MAKKRNAHEKKYQRRQINMQLRFAEAAEVATMDLIEAKAKETGKSESCVARDLLVTAANRRAKKR